MSSATLATPTTGLSSTSTIPQRSPSSTKSPSKGGLSEDSIVAICTVVGTVVAILTLIVAIKAYKRQKKS